LEKGPEASRRVEPSKPQPASAAPRAPEGLATPSEKREQAEIEFENASAPAGAEDGAADVAQAGSIEDPVAGKAEGSALAALQRRFESHKVTALADKSR